MVFKTISVYGISVFLIFTVTLACFPAITVLVKSSSLPDGTFKEEDYPWGTKLFIPVCCFVLFNVGDWLGRFSAEMIQWPKPGRFGMFLVLALSLLRLGKYEKCFRAIVGNLKPWVLLIRFYFTILYHSLESRKSCIKRMGTQGPH